MKALILSAGEGTRVRPVTLGRPKPMVEVGGRPLLEHLIGLLRRHGVTHIALNLHYKPEAILDYFGDGSRFGVRIEYSWEQRLLGTAGAAKQLEWFFTDPFFVLYGDVLTNIDLGALAREHSSHSGLGTLVLYEPDDLTRCGVAEVAADGRVTAFVEKPLQPIAGGLANSGICVFEPAVLAYVPLGQTFDFGGDLIPLLISRGFALYGQIGGIYILDIGSLERYGQAQADYRAGRYVSP